MIGLAFNKPLYRFIFGLLARVQTKFVGTGDRIIRPISSEVTAGKIPNAKLVRVEDGSHCFPFEMKDVFNREVLNFLRCDAPSVN